jgi:hypothetical protein
VGTLSGDRSDRHSPASAAFGRGGVRVERGVVDYVNARGGELYVWAEPFGSFARTCADTEPPPGVTFTRSDAVTEFALFVESGLDWPSVTLARRWRGLRDGVVAETGHWVVAGG